MELDLSGQNLLNSWKLINNGVTTNGTGASTVSFGTDTTFNRVDTSYPSTQAYVWGFSYGANVKGDPSATSYLWSSTAGLGSARPFTQMYIRPKLKLADISFGTIADSGTSKVEQTPLAESDAQRTVWGVTGLADGVNGELHTEVGAFTQIGDIVYVGGNFKYVQRDSAGLGQVEQSYLAGFNVNTGEWLSSFRPTFNGQVKSLAKLPDGRLAVGGDFSAANGATTGPLVFLDPSSGATQGTQVTVEDRAAGEVAFVRGLSVQGSNLYLAGATSHIVGGTTTALARNGGRINLTTMKPDTNWNPTLNGSAVAIDASPVGDRVYFAGYFTMSRTTTTKNGTAIQTTAGAPLTNPVWPTKFSSTTANYQQAVKEIGNRVYLGGSQHSFFGYDRSNLGFLTGSITRAGGDFQAMSLDGLGNIYGGCHCADFNYQDTTSYSTPQTTATEVDAINLTGAWDGATGKYEPEFSPTVKTRNGYGTWALFTDSTGTLWAGGSYTSSIRPGFVNQWSGGFVRFGARDVAAPTTPANFTKSDVDTNTFQLQWNASTDNRGPISYEVIEDNKVIASTTQRSINLTRRSGDHKYFVRALDGAKNRSASTSALLVSTNGSTQSVSYVANGSAWKWQYTSKDASAAWWSTWRDVAFDDSSWNTGNAVLGFATTGQSTDIKAGAPTPNPLSAQYRRAFTVDDPTKVQSVEISVIANDGAVVYVNGTEVGRKNMPTGAITHDSYATAAPRSTTAAGAPLGGPGAGQSAHDGVRTRSLSTPTSMPGPRSTPRWTCG